MKRSEMLDLLHDFYCDYHDGESSTSFNERLLKLIEKAGMLPPSYEQIGGNPEFLLYSVNVNEWEPEDEK